MAFQYKVGERYPPPQSSQTLCWSKCPGITWTMRIPLCSQWHNIWAVAHGTRWENHGKLSYVIMDSQILETGRLTWIWLDSQFQLTHVWRIEDFHLILASRHEIGDVRLVRSCCRSTCWHGCFLLIPQKRSTGESWRPSVLETPWPPCNSRTWNHYGAPCNVWDPQWISHKDSPFGKKPSPDLACSNRYHQLFIAQLCDSSSGKTGFAVEVSSRALLQTDIEQGTSEIRWSSWVRMNDGQVYILRTWYSKWFTLQLVLDI